MDVILRGFTQHDYHKKSMASSSERVKKRVWIFFTSLSSFLSCLFVANFDTESLNYIHSTTLNKMSYICIAWKIYVNMWTNDPIIWISIKINDEKNPRDNLAGLIDEINIVSVRTKIFLCDIENRFEVQTLHRHTHRHTNSYVSPNTYGVYKLKASLAFCFSSDFAITLVQKYESATSTTTTTNNSKEFLFLWWARSAIINLYKCWKLNKQ